MIINGKQYKRMRGTVFTHKEFRGVSVTKCKQYGVKRCRPSSFFKFMWQTHRIGNTDAGGKQLWGKYFMIYVCAMDRFLEPHICLN